MRKAMRALFVLLMAYLLQTTVLPHLKIAGVMVDLATVALFAAGYYLGVYGAVTSGLLMGLWMETLTGELGGLVAVVCLTTSSIGAYAAHRFENLDRAGKRGLDRMLRWVAPPVIVGLIVIARESIYLVYFYLTGVDIRTIHFFRVALAGLVVGAIAAALLPLLGGFMLRAKEDTFLAKRAERWKNRKKPSPVELLAPAPEITQIREPTVLDWDADDVKEDLKDDAKGDPKNDAKGDDPPDLSAYRRPEPEPKVESIYEFSSSYQRLPPKAKEKEGKPKPADDADDWGF